MGAEKRLENCPSFALISKTVSEPIALKEQTVIGRETGLNHHGISRRHCVIRIRGKQFIIADTNSTYGTFINGARLQPKSWSVIGRDDRICLGNIEFVLTEVGLSETQNVDPVINEIENDHDEQTKNPSNLPMIYRTRLAARIVDSILMYGLGFLVRQFTFYQGVTGNRAMFDSLIFLIAYSGVVLLPMFVSNQTIGKKLVGLRVLTTDQLPLSPGLMIIREALLKEGMIILMAALYFILNAAHPLVCTIAFMMLAVGLIVNTCREGTLYWDQICDTQVVSLKSRSQTYSKETPS